MTKDDLIEQLAEIAYANKGPSPGRLGWAVASPQRKQECRDEVMQEELPLFVEFVAGWLVQRSAGMSDHQPEALDVAEWFIGGWREEMR